MSKLHDKTGARFGNTSHGKYGTPSYRSWQAMLARCRNARATNYKWYGGRGIGIDDPRWFSFQNFFEDMGDKPPGCDLHRKENGKGYSKENCVWLPHAEHVRLHRLKLVTEIERSLI